MSKGAFTYGAGKRMSSSKSGLTGSGKMSSAHGLNSGNSTKSMRHAEGRIGAGCPGFEKGLLGEPGYKGGGTAHAAQPSGHKKDA